MRHPLCLLRAIWRSLRCLAIVSGCEYKTIDDPTPANVHVLRCEVCGKTSVGWSWGSLESVK